MSRIPDHEHRAIAAIIRAAPAEFIQAEDTEGLVAAVNSARKSLSQSLRAYRRDGKYPQARTLLREATRIGYPVKMSDPGKSPNPKPSASMNHIINDRGETVPAVGAPGSIMRVQDEWPEGIKSLKEAREKRERARAENPSFDSRAESEADLVATAEELHRRGIPHGLDATSVLKVVGYDDETARAISGQLRIIIEYQDHELRDSMLALPKGPQVGPKNDFGAARG